jgi:hypothetical protein
MIRRIRAIGIASLCALGTALSLRAQSSVPRIEGSIVDSIRHRPLAGATVIATPRADIRDSVFHSARSDDKGHFVVVGLHAGRYTLSVEHPFIDSTGVGALPVDVIVPTDGTATAALGIPSPATLLLALCPIAAANAELGVMLGVVRRPDGTPVSAATVVFTWGDFDVDRSTALVKRSQLSASAITDATGVYRACGLPTARSLLVQAQSGTEEQTGVLEEKIEESGILVRDFHLAPGGLAATSDVASRPLDSASASERFTVAGHVRRTSGQPIESAQVRLVGTTVSATTNGAGEFRLAGVPAGTQGVEVVALGYYPQRFRVEVAAETHPLVVRLERAAAVLDSIRVTAKRVNRTIGPNYREFDTRAAHGAGFYITEEQIRERRAIETTDILKLVPEVHVFDFGSTARVVAARGRTNIGNTECPLDVFINGNRVNQTDVNTIAPHTIHGIEIYTVATAPASYVIGPCGAIFIWSK